MTNRRLLQAVLCSTLLVSVTETARAQTPAAATPPMKATVQQLAWVAGAWSGTLGDRTIEQHWSAPLGNSIVAMYRSVQNDRASLYELLAIEQEADGVVLRIKHFAPGAGLVGREAKDESVNHALVSLDGKTAVFEGIATDNPPRITFTSPDVDTLNIVVQRKRDGVPVSTEFKYKRLQR